ncbi:hypothetical protein MPSEU_001023800 [Mayamaea pseudoterrestris]|nr:hypothetical protein MPSEU_001023800 [Mayamaea pseudoterrestris]
MASWPSPKLHASPSSPSIRRHASTNPYQDEETSRRAFMLKSLAYTTPYFIFASSSFADFAPGGTLVDYTVGVQVGNPQASASRKADNSNVIFALDYYFKFGTAPPFVSDDSFPKSMPFVPVKQRYEAIKKYQV